MNRKQSEVLVQAPTMADVLAARHVVQRYMNPTPLHTYDALNQHAGARIWVKHENHTPIGAFKLRGGLVFMQRLRERGDATGVVTASTGNHGQSIAYAAREFGLRAIIVVPESANPVKVTAMRSLDAEVVFHGPDFDAARRHGTEMAQKEGFRFISSGDEPDLIAGVATYTLEIMEQVPELDYLFIPMGGGSGAAGACVVAHALNPDTRVVAVQSAQAPAGYESWRARAFRSAPNRTMADGLAISEPFMLPQSVLWQRLHDFQLVEDEAIWEAMALLFRLTKNVAEPAGASSLAAALQMKEAIQDRQCAVILSGGNISVAQLRRLLERLPSH